MMLTSKMKELRHSDMLSHVSGLGYLPRWSVLLLDVFICFTAFWVSVLIGKGVFEYQELGKDMSLWIQCLSTVGVQVLCFWIFHTYSGILRYSTFVDTLKILFSVLLNGAVLLLTNYIIFSVTGQKYFLNTVIYY